MEDTRLINLLIKFSHASTILTFYDSYFGAYMLMTLLSKTTKEEWSRQYTAYLNVFTCCRRPLSQLYGGMFDQEFCDYLSTNKRYMHYDLRIKLFSSKCFKRFNTFLTNIRGQRRLCISSIDLGVVVGVHKFEMYNKILEMLFKEEVPRHNIHIRVKDLDITEVPLSKLQGEWIVRISIHLV